MRFCFESAADVPSHSGLTFDPDKPYVWINSSYKLQHIAFAGVNKLDLEIEVEYAETQNGQRERACHYKVVTSAHYLPI